MCENLVKNSVLNRISAFLAFQSKGLKVEMGTSSPAFLSKVDGQNWICHFYMKFCVLLHQATEAATPIAPPILCFLIHF